MTNIIVFEGNNEVIVCRQENVEEIVEEYFVETGRELEHYDVFLIDGKQAVRISADVSATITSKTFEIFDTLSLSLQNKINNVEEI